MATLTHIEELESIRDITEDLFIHIERLKVLENAVSNYFTYIADLNGTDHQKASAHYILSHQTDIRCFLDMISEIASYLEENNDLIGNKIDDFLVTFKMAIEQNANSAEVVKVG